MFFLMFHFSFPMYHHKLTTPKFESHIRFESFICDISNSTHGSNSVDSCAP